MTVVVGLLRMDDLPEHAQHVLGDYPDLFTHLFADEDVDLVDIRVHRGDGPASLDDADVWLLGGSRHSVYDELPWIADALDLTRRLIAEERPTVGICFGHQLLGEALGGRVGPAGRWGVGVQSYRTIAPLDWFPEAGSSVELIASHRDQVLEVPPEAEVWSGSAYCPVAGLRVGGRAWSVQGHPEFTADVAHVLYEGRRAELGHESVDAARASLATRVSNRALARAIVRFATG